MSLEVYSPFAIAEIPKDQLPKAPLNIAGLVDRLFTIPRFVDEKYPAGIFFDNVGAHSTRLDIMTDMVNIPGIDRKKLKRMSWIHDIPEIEIGEHIAPRKEADKFFSQSLKKAEIIAAQSLLSPQDVELLFEFNASGDLLKGEPYDPNVVSREGLIISVLDKIDGNMYFHWAMANWVSNSDGTREIPSRTAMEYTFRQRDQFIESLKTVSDKWPEAVSACISLLGAQIDYIISVWKEVPPEKQPQIIKSQLEIISS